MNCREYTQKIFIKLLRELELIVKICLSYNLSIKLCFSMKTAAKKLITKDISLDGIFIHILSKNYGMFA